MFEAAELNRRVAKAQYKEREPVLRAELLDVQNRLRASGSCPAIIVFAGVDGAGKGETVNLLNQWMDPRWVVTRAFGEPSDEERERPADWRFWRELPPTGRIGLFLSSWYSRPVLDRVYGRLSGNAFEHRLNHIVEFEQMLAGDGALILKFWMHLGKRAQRARLKKLEKDPLFRWKVGDLAWKHWRMYDKFIETAEHTIRQTNRGDAPWMIVEGADARYRSLTVGEAIRDAIRRHVGAIENGKTSVAVTSAIEKTVPGTPQAPARNSKVITILSSLDMKLRLTKAKASEETHQYQGQLNRLARKAAGKGVSTILLFEGWDASGKGGAIRRITGSLDARQYQVIPIAAPNDEERAHHYLWRFWRHLPRSGRVRIFDRSWYGRVLVERVEGFATEKEWMRAYAEINQFETQLTEHGIVLVKYWLHITSDEQLRRFKAREAAPHKRWKLTEEDWRNREKWNAYELAVNDMIERTSTAEAPWTLIEGNDKNYARVKVLKTVCDRLSAAL